MRIPTLCRGALAVAASVCSVLAVAAQAAPVAPSSAAPFAGHYRHFRTAVYIPVNVTRSLADRRNEPVTVRVVRHAARDTSKAAAETVPAEGKDAASEITVPPHSFRVFTGA